MSATFAIARGTYLFHLKGITRLHTNLAKCIVKQEIGRLGILPYPEFWASSTILGTPGPALLLHWIFSTILIAVAPLSNANGYLVISTVFTYARTAIASE